MKLMLIQIWQHCNDECKNELSFGSLCIPYSIRQRPDMRDQGLAVISGRGINKTKNTVGTSMCSYMCSCRNVT